MMPVHFRDLLRRARGGDRDAMDQVLRELRYQLEPMSRQLAATSGQAVSSSDLLQECCLRAWQKLDTFRGGQNDEETFEMFRAWIGQILRRASVDAHRHRSAKSRIPPERLLPLPSSEAASTGRGGEQVLPAATATPSAGARAEEMAQAIRGALEHLPDETAARVVRMRFFDGLTIVQIAERLSLSPVMVRERHRSAMRRLERELSNWLPEWL